MGLLSLADELGTYICEHPKIVPYGYGHWGRCTQCGDDSFPLTEAAAGDYGQHNCGTLEIYLNGELQEQGTDFEGVNDVVTWDASKGFEKEEPFSMTAWFKTTGKGPRMRNTLQDITAEKTVVLAKLKENREKHIGIVQEAKAGYVKKVQAALEARLDEVKSGKVVDLDFNLSRPQDYTKEYDRAIQMLELHTGSEIELSSELVASFIMDDWDWKGHFLASNSGYSVRAAHAHGMSG